jgi:hypothetical protein
MGGDDIAQQTEVGSPDGLCRVVAQGLQQLRRADEVREEQRDDVCAARGFRHTLTRPLESR